MKIFIHLKALWVDFRRVQRNKGLVSAIKISINFISSSPRMLPTSYKYQDRRTDLSHRWELISSEIDPDAQNSIDIGCNQGKITKKAAEYGLFSVGIEKKQIALVQARRSTDKLDSCHFLRLELNPKNINQLPAFDVTFLLTVYYHWVSQYGQRAADLMLRSLARRTNQLFLETPITTDKIPSLRINLNNGDVEEAILHHFQEVIGESASVKSIGRTDYKGGKRKDLVIGIDCSSYD